MAKGGSLGRALKGVEQPPKMRRYNTQSTIEPSMDSEANLSSSDPSHFSSFEKQQHEDDSSFEQQHYDDRHFRQGSPASSEASEVAAEISKVDVQDLSSWNLDEQTTDDPQSSQHPQAVEDAHTAKDQQSEDAQTAKDQQSEDVQAAKDQQSEGAQVENTMPPPSSTQQISSSPSRQETRASRLRRRHPPQSRISVTYSSTVKEDDVYKKWKKLTKHLFAQQYPKLTAMIGIDAMLWCSKLIHPPISQHQQPSISMLDLQISPSFQWNGWLLLLKQIR